ncbi:MAG: hypothetical protein AAGK37_12410 [Pseudomonadota bacterium]
MPKYTLEDEQTLKVLFLHSGTNWMAIDKLTEPLANYGSRVEKRCPQDLEFALAELVAISRAINLMTTEEKAANLERVIELTRSSGRSAAV